MPLLRAWPSLLYLLRAITAFENPLHSCVSMLKITSSRLEAIAPCLIVNKFEKELFAIRPRGSVWSEPHCLYSKPVAVRMPEHEFLG